MLPGTSIDSRKGIAQTVDLQNTTSVTASSESMGEAVLWREDIASPPSPLCLFACAMY